MKKISLLPVEIRKQNQQSQQRLLYVVLTGVILFFVLAVVGFFSLLSMNTRNELKALQAERSLLERRIASLQDYEDMRKQIASTDEIIRAVTKDVPDWGARVGDLSSRLPYGVWLTEVTAGARTGETKYTATSAFSVVETAEVFSDITLKGWSLDQQLLTNWLEEIRDLPGFIEVRLKYSMVGVYRGTNAIQFEIVAIPKNGV